MCQRWSLITMFYLLEDAFNDITHKNNMDIDIEYLYLDFHYPSIFHIGRQRLLVWIV